MKDRRTTKLELGIGTTGGVTFFRGRPGAWESMFASLEGEDVSVLRHHPGKAGTIFAGTYGNGLFQSDDGGKSWARRDAGQPHLRTVAFDAEDPETVYAGTEPAELYRSRDGGETWSSVGLRDLPEAPSWSLPYSPRAGALRALLVPPRRPGLIYAGVEQGGLIKSEDGGNSWTVTENGVHKDIHSLGADEEDPEVLYAATGGGFFRTRDGGRTWNRLLDGYTRGTCVLPGRPQVVLAGPAEDVGEGGDLLLSEDAGETWRRVLGGMGEHPLPDMVEVMYGFPELPDYVFAVRDDGTLYEAKSGEWRWNRLAADLEGIQTISLTA